MIGSFRNTALSALTGAALLGAVPALAADLYTPPPPAPLTPSQFDIAFGVTFTSDFVSRGISQTMGDPAVQGYAELSYGLFYAGVWASNVDFGGGANGVEFDLYAGIRPEFGKFAFDFGYVHYLYTNNAAGDFGEIYAKVDYSATDILTLSGAVFYAPSPDAVYAEGGVALALPHNLELSAAIGHTWVSGGDYLNWNAGISWTYKDFMTVDLRYHDTDVAGGCMGLCDARFVASLSFDTTMSAIRGSGL